MNCKVSRQKVLAGLEKCASIDCKGCPYDGHYPCQNKLANDALDLLLDQSERIKRLLEGSKILVNALKEYEDD